MTAILGLDTSMYTTSAALADMRRFVFGHKRVMLDVAAGERGLRQSEALYMHIKSIGGVIDGLMEQCGRPDIIAVCASVRPRPKSGSYMPVFRAGEAVGRSIASALGVPFIETSHQEGHIIAAAKGLADRDWMAFHLSGGTSELVKACIRGGLVSDIEIAGRTLDISAGQLVDRAGVAMGLPFPSGTGLEKLAEKASDNELRLPSFVKGLDFSFSGAENEVMKLIKCGKRSEAAYAVYACISATLAKLIANALEMGMPREFLLGGGVACSALLRRMLINRLQKRRIEARLFFAEPEFCSDNAVGVALIGAAEMARRGEDNIHRAKDGFYDSEDN
ncbi:MAG: O-sialoglycoprotein endopeptidase [Christensenellales bacterium]